MKLLQEKALRSRQRKLFEMYPDRGPLRRDLYGKHLAFFSDGKRYRERLFLAANRVGKTEGAGGYETALHLTGLYPRWWKGWRFARPIKAWAAGDTRETTRDIVQAKLLGPLDEMGTGLLPGRFILSFKRKSGVQDSVDFVKVRHVSGGTSVLKFKSYDQKRHAFQGTEQDLIWLDEEPPLDVYSECLVRTMTTNGRLMLTFTPLKGISDVVMAFLPGGKLPEDR